MFLRYLSLKRIPDDPTNNTAAMISTIHISEPRPMLLARFRSIAGSIDNKAPALREAPFEGLWTSRKQASALRRGLGLGLAAASDHPQIFHRLLCECRRREDGPIVPIEKVKPVRDIRGMIRARLVHETERRAEKRRPKLGNQFLKSIVPVTEPLSIHAIEPMRGARPMRQFVQKDGVVRLGR